MTTDYIHLNGVHGGGNQIIEQVGENLIAFFEWGLLEAGFYDDVRIYSLGDDDSPYAAPETLKPVAVPKIADGKVWQAEYRNWVYESGLESTRQPIQVSGIYVDGGFHSVASTGQYAHHIDYFNGRVVFDTPIPVNSVVQANYSYKRIGLYDESFPWFNSVVFDEYGTEPSTQILPSGVSNLLKNHGIQLPLILVEGVASQRLVPRELGNVSQWVYQDFLMHVIAENSQDRNNIVDILVRQKDKSFYLFDCNRRAMDNAYALDFQNKLVLSKPLYPALVSPPPVGYRMSLCRFYNMRGSESYSRPPIFRAVVRATMEVDDSVPFSGWRVGEDGIRYQTVSFGTRRYGPYNSTA